MFWDIRLPRGSLAPAWVGSPYCWFPSFDLLLKGWMKKVAKDTSLTKYEMRSNNPSCLSANNQWPTKKLLNLTLLKVMDHETPWPCTFCFPVCLLVRWNIYESKLNIPISLQRLEDIYYDYFLKADIVFTRKVIAPEDWKKVTYFGTTKTIRTSTIKEGHFLMANTTRTLLYIIVAAPTVTNLSPSPFP